MSGFLIPAGTIGSGMRGRVKCMRLGDAEGIRDAKREEGLRVRMDDPGLTQGKRIHPITVWWWV